jgi:Kef-type K+ transport system membrane component KefB
MDVILQVFVIFVAAKAAAEVFVRMDLPAIAGELLVGVLIGPHVAGLIELNDSILTLSELGIVVLLFTVGLETPLSELLSVGRAALLTSLVGILVTLGTGILVTLAFGHQLDESVLVGTALSASSVGVGARVFQDLGLITTRQARVVLGAAVLDDVVVLALYPLVQGLGKAHGSVGAILVGLAGGIGFVVLIGALGSRLARRHPGLLETTRARRSPFVLALALCLGLAALAEQVGLAALVGAFLAGMVLAETRDRYELDRRMLPLIDFLVPFFFVATAAKMDIARVLQGGLGLTLVLTTVTIAAKLAGCALGAAGLPRRERLQVGAGMIPRNEVALVVATSSLASAGITSEVFSVIVASVLVSTLVAAPILRLAIPAHERHRPEQPGEVPPEATGRQP